MQRQADRDKIAEEAVGQRHESAPPYAAKNEEVSQEEAARHLAGSAGAQATTPERTAESVGERVGNAAGGSRIRTHGPTYEPTPTPSGKGRHQV